MSDVANVLSLHITALCVQDLLPNGKILIMAHLIAFVSLNNKIIINNLVEYFDITEFQNIEISNIKPPDSHRVTFGFWINISNVTSMTKILHVVLTDFLVMTIAHDSSYTDGLKTYCTPHQILNKYSSTNIENLTERVGFPPTNIVATPISVSIKEVDTMWYYTQCAINYNKSTDFYVKVNYKFSTPYKTLLKTDVANGGVVTGTLAKEKLYSVNGNDTYTDVNFRKVYSTSDFISIRILNAGLMQGTNQIFMRNMYVYNEFLPSNMEIQHMYIIF